MQRNLSEISTYRSSADRSLIINAERAVLTIVGNNKAPFQATLYLELLSHSVDDISSSTQELTCDLRSLRYCMTAEYGDHNGFRYRSTEYGIDGPGIQGWCTTRGAPIHLENKSYFTKAISREQAKMIEKFARVHQQKYHQNPNKYNTLTSLDFYRQLLLEAKTLNENEQFILTPAPPKKNYPERALALSSQVFGKVYQPIDAKRESDFAAQLLPSLPSSDTLEVPLNLTPLARLQCFFKAHQDGVHVIDWGSEEGLNIQFLEDRLGLLVFSYQTALGNCLEKNTAMPSTLIQLIVEYTSDKIEPLYSASNSDSADKSRCLMM